MKPISQRAYARHRGCHLNAVQEAIASGRLTEKGGSLVRVGKVWKIASIEAADAEWAATTHSDRIPLTGPASGGAPPDLAVSRARREAAEAELAEIELAREQAELIPARDVEVHLVNVFARCKTKLMGVPSRARQQDPDLSPAQLALLEGLIREALDDLSSPPTKPQKQRARKSA